MKRRIVKVYATHLLIEKKFDGYTRTARIRFCIVAAFQVVNFEKF